MSTTIEMIAKISGGHGLRGALNYDFSPCKKTGKPRAELIAGTLQGTPRQICQQAAPLRALRDVSKPIWRVSLNADPSDGILTSKKWTEICHDFLHGMGLNPTKTAWCAVRHIDHHHDPNPRDHIHLTVLRVQPDGTLFKVANDVFRSKKVTQMLEIKHQLQKHNRERAERHAPSIAQISATKRTSKMTSISIIQNHVDQIFSEEKNDLTYEKLREKLLEKGTGIRDTKTQKGRLQGFSYVDLKSGVAIAGSKLGTDYSLGMLARGLKYSQNPAQETPASVAQGRTPKMPDMLEPILSKQQPSAIQFRPMAAQTEEFQAAKLDLSAVVDLDIGPLSKVMLLIGGLLINFASTIVDKFIAFIRAILARFGFGMREAALQTIVHPSKQNICYEPYVPEAKTLPAPSAGEAACEQLIQIHEALQNNNPTLLPEGVGREELVAAMQAESGISGGAGVGAANEFDFGINAVDIPQTKTTTSADPVDLMAALATALTVHEAATKALRNARIKKGFIYFDERPKAWQARNVAQEKLQSMVYKFDRWKSQNPVLSNFPSKARNVFLTEIKRLEGVAEAATAAAKVAETADVDAEERYKSLPTPIPPKEVIAAEQSCREAVKQARIAVQNDMLVKVQVLRQNQMLEHKLKELATALKTNFGQFESTDEVSKRDFDALTNIQVKIQMLVVQERVLNAQQDYEQKGDDRADQYRG